MCLACRERETKAKFIRISWNGEKLVFDKGGYGQGRGCYVHSSPECIARIVKKGLLARALRVSGSELGMVQLTIFKDLLEAANRRAVAREFCN